MNCEKLCVQCLENTRSHRFVVCFILLWCRSTAFAFVVTVPAATTGCAGVTSQNQKCYQDALQDAIASWRASWKSTNFFKTLSLSSRRSFKTYYQDVSSRHFSRHPSRRSRNFCSTPAIKQTRFQDAFRNFQDARVWCLENKKASWNGVLKFMWASW